MDRQTLMRANALKIDIQDTRLNIQRLRNFLENVELSIFTLSDPQISFTVQQQRSVTQQSFSADEVILLTILETQLTELEDKLVELQDEFAELCCKEEEP